MLNMNMLVVVMLLVGATFSASPIMPARYFVAVPKVLYVGSYSTISISVTNIISDLNVTVKVMKDKNEVNIVSTTLPYESASVMKQIQFYVPKDLISSNCNLMIQAKGDLAFRKVFKNVEVRSPKDKILIQTDKPIYKPGGTVKFRIISIDKDLNPNIQPIEEIFITNPTGSRMMQWTNTSLDQGVISLEMPLSVKPVLGEWKIAVKSHGIDVAQTIVVKKYVLPKFKVTITSPPYLLKKDNSVLLKVCARYTHGKFVRGNLNIDVCYNSLSTNRQKNCESFKKTIKDCEDIVYRIKFHVYPYAGLEARASVTEDGSGAVVSTHHLTQPFVESDVKMKFEVSEFYKPGFAIKVKLLLNTPDGRPMTKSKQVKLTIRRGGSKYVRLERSFRSRRKRDFIVMSQTIIVSNGIYEHTFVSIAESKFYTFEAKYDYQTKVINVMKPKRIDLMKRHFKPMKETQRKIKIASEYAYGRTEPWFSPSNSFLKIESISNLQHAGDTARIHVRFSANLLHTYKDLNYLVVCKGKIMVASRKESDGQSIDEYLSFRVLEDMSPKCRVLVYYISDDGEFISDNKIITLGTSFRNKVSLEFSSDEKKPGESVNLILKAASGSLFAIAAVDKSILLMADNNDVKADQLISFLGDQDVYSKQKVSLEETSCKHNSKWNVKSIKPLSADGTHAIQETGLLYFTNAKVNVLPCSRYKVIYKLWRFRPPIRHGFGKIFRALNVKVENLKPVKNIKTYGREEKAKPATKVRTEFPETWLWTEQHISSSGEKKLTVKVPDTITTWHANGFAISSTHGMGVASSTNIRGFQPFFVSLSLPYSVKRGETVKIPAMIFNYLDECIIVQLNLKQTTDFVAVSELSKKVCVCGGSSKSFKFNIKPTSLGKIDINVGAHTISTTDSNICHPNSTMSSDVTAADALTKKLLVEAEGIKKEYSKSVYFCPKDWTSTSGRFIGNLSLDLPQAIVPGSVFAELAITGDMLGPSMEGLDKLLAMPYGCGEQNMLKFAPNIYIMDYLTATDQVESGIEKQAKSFMASGYQRELTYKHKDGAYSAFGERDKEGSTWLTAFVLRTYAQARRYIFIDPKDIQDSKDWLLSLQMSSGCFKEVGMVHHKEMKGGVTSGITMTAFVLIALLEAEVPRNNAHIGKALECMEGQLDKVEDYYTAAVLAFALKYGGSTKADLMLKMLREGVIQDENGIHWEDNKGKRTKISKSWYYHQARSADIETTAYALMAYMGGRDKFGSRFDHLKIVEWLVKQRNPYGGFSSTQDTCVGLQALSHYAASTYSGSFDLDIQTTYNSMQTTFAVNKYNKIVLQKHQINSELPLNVQIEASGEGCALIQANVKYNEPEPGTETSFMLHVNIKQEKNSLTCLHRIQVCGTYTGEGKSNMALIDVNMVSGFEPIIDDLDIAIQSDVAYTQYEFNDDVLSLYFDEFGQKTQCAKFSIQQVAEVEGRKPASIVVYDYYDKDNSATKMYTVGECPEVNIVS